MLVWSPWVVYGTAAVPPGTPDTYGAIGNTTTCTMQGFFNQLSGMCIALYYAGLSAYSWAVVVHGNFDPTKYSFIEDYIHAVVHTFPVGSAVYLLSIEAYNSTGLTCYISSIPFGCGDDSGIECVRGPQNITTVIWAAAGVPGLFCVLFPTLVMLTLFCKVCRIHAANATAVQSRQLLFGMTPSTVCRQAAVYLGAIYLIYLPQYAYFILSVMADEKRFGAAVTMSVIATSRGLWIALVYRYFSSYGSSAAFGGLRFRLHPNFRLMSVKRHKRGIKRTSSVTGSLPTESEETNPTASVDERQQQQQDGEGPSAVSNDVDNDKKRLHRKTMVHNSSFRNIFDGTNIAGVGSNRFADFVFKEDEEDAEEDYLESKFWSECEDYNSERLSNASTTDARWSPRDLNRQQLDVSTHRTCLVMREST